MQPHRTLVIRIIRALVPYDPEIAGAAMARSIQFRCTVSFSVCLATNLTLTFSGFSFNLTTQNNGKRETNFINQKRREKII